MNAASAVSFDNTFARELEGLYHKATAAQFPAPRLLALNRGLASELGFDPAAWSEDDAARLLVGERLPDGATPLAQVYAGHQFGGFSPMLGDGRALLVGEVIDVHGRRRDIHLKGSGPTQFSRGGDGKASVGPMLREYLIGEAMHGLGIPTTRALGVAATGEMVFRERPLPGAVMARVAASHLRVGTFEFFAARQQHAQLRRLADYTIARHYPEIADTDSPYIELVRAVARAQGELVAGWMLVGFVHGVMNTDNVTISGESIDYGPCAFIDAYDPASVFSSIDELGRYAYGNQPRIALWNLARFAETLLSLIDDDEAAAIKQAEVAIHELTSHYDAAWLAGMRRKLGLRTASPDDKELAEDLLALMHAHHVDFTLAFRRLGDIVRGSPEPFGRLFAAPEPASEWLARYATRRAAESDASAQETAAAMDRANPIYIPRNHNTEEALTAAADEGDLAPFERLVEAVSDPFVRRDHLRDLEGPAPEGFGRYVTYCGT